MKLGSLSTYLPLASSLWMMLLSVVWALTPSLSPSWYNFTVSIVFGVLALAYLILTAGLWIGVRPASPLAVALLASGGLIWAALSSFTSSLIDLISIVLLLVSALTVFAAWRRRVKSSFHPLDYPVYG